MKIILLLLGILAICSGIHLTKDQQRLMRSNFIQMDLTDVRNDPDVQGLLQFGVQDLLQRGIQDHRIPLSNFKVGDVLNVEKQDLGLGAGAYYNFDFNMNNADGTQILASMTIFYNKDNLHKEIVNSEYQVQSLLEVGTDSEQSGGYTSVDVSEASKADVNAALQYGVSQIINKGISDQKLPLAQYTLTKVNSIQRQTTGSGTNYKFDVNIGNNDGTTTVTATFTIFTRTSTQENSMTAYSYNVKTTTTTVKAVEPIESRYQSVSQSDANADKTIQTCLNFGLDEILTQAFNEGKINDKGYKLSTLVSVEQQTVEDYSFYRFNVELTKKDSTLTASFTVVYNLKTKNTGMKSLLYKVTTKTETATVTADGYTTIEVLDVQRLDEVRAAMQYGVSQIISIGLQEKKIPISVFTVSSVLSAGKQTVGTTVNYKFELELNNNAGTTISAVITVTFNTKTGEYTLAAYNYSVKSLNTIKTTIQPDETAYVEVSASSAAANSDIQSAIDFCTTEVLKQALSQGKITNTGSFKQSALNRVLTQTVSGVLFLKLDVDLKSTESGTTSTLNYNAVVSSNIASGEKQVRSYNFNIKTSKTSKTVVKEPLDSEYKDVSSSEYSSNTDLQSALQEGVSVVVQAALKEGKIKTAEFRVDKINSVKSAGVKDSIFFKYDVTLTNDKDSTMSVTMTVLHESSGKNTVRAYNYNVKTSTVNKVVIKDPNDDDYTDVSDNEVEESTEIQNALEFARIQVIQDALSEDKISGNDFYIDQIRKVGRAIVKKNTFYRFVIVLNNDVDTTITATIYVLYDQKTALNSLRKLTYSVKVVQNIISTINEPADQDYTVLSEEDLDTDRDLKKAFQTGLKLLIQAANDEGKVTTSDFTVNKIVSIKKATVKVFTFYRFEVVLFNEENGTETTVTASFTLVHSGKTGEDNMRRYNYNVKVVSYSVQNIQEPNDNQFTSIDIDSVTSTEDINAIFQFGVSSIIQVALQEGKIASGEGLAVTAISQASYATVRQFVFYRFSFTLDNDDDTTIQVSVTLVHDNRSGDNGLRKYSYNVTITQTLITDIQEPDEDRYKDFDLNEDETGRQAFEFGAKEIVAKALEEGKITATNFNVKTITFTRRVTVKKYVFYRFSFVLDNGDDTTVDVTLTIVHSAKTGDNSLRRYNYNVVITQTLITDIQEPADELYTDLEIDSVTTNENVKGSFQYGITQILEAALAEGKIENTNFNVKTVEFVRTATVKKFTFYRFSFTLDNGDDTTIDVTMTIVFSAKTGEFSVRRYNYNVTVTHVYASTAPEPGDDEYTDLELTVVQTDDMIKELFSYSAKEMIAAAYRDGKIVSTENFVVQNVISVRKATYKRFVFYQFGFTLFNGDDATITATVTLAWDSKTSDKDIRNYIYGVTIVQTLISDVQEPSEDQYEEFEVSEVQGDRDILAIFQWGAKELIAKALEEGNIQSTNFNVKVIKSAKRVTVKKFTFYRFEYTLDDGEGMSIDASMTVIHGSADGENLLRRYYYTVTFTQTLITDVVEPGDDQYEEIDISEVEGSTLITGAYEYGVSELLKVAISEGKISNANLTVQTVVSAKRAVVKGYTFYRFNLILDNGYDTTMTASLTVIVNTKTSEMSLRRYVYQITIKTVNVVVNETQITFTNKYTVIEITEQVTHLCDVSIEQIIKYLYDEGIISTVNFKLVKIINVYEKFEFGVYTVKFVVQVKNSFGLTLDITFTVDINENWEGEITYYSITGSHQEVNSIICIDKNSTQLVVGNFETVSLHEFQGCKDIQGTYQAGLQQLNQLLEERGELEDLDLKVTNIQYIYRQFLLGVNYRFGVELENSSGDRVVATFTISSDHRQFMGYYTVLRND